MEKLPVSDQGEMPPLHPWVGTGVLHPRGGKHKGCVGLSAGVQLEHHFPYVFLFPHLLGTKPALSSVRPPRAGWGRVTQGQGAVIWIQQLRRARSFESVQAAKGNMPPKRNLFSQRVSAPFEDLSPSVPEPHANLCDGVTSRTLPLCL